MDSSDADDIKKAASSVGLRHQGNPSKPINVLYSELFSVKLGHNKSNHFCQFWHLNYCTCILVDEEPGMLFRVRGQVRRAFEKFYF